MELEQIIKERIKSWPDCVEHHYELVSPKMLSRFTQTYNCKWCGHEVYISPAMMVQIKFNTPTDTENGKVHKANARAAKRNAHAR